MLQNFIDILAAPTAVFERLKTRPQWAAPLLLLLVTTASVQIGYFQLTDFNYLIDEMLEQALAANPNARASEVRTALDSLNPTILGISSSVAVVLMILVMNCLYAGYLSFLTKFSSHDYRFRHWFSLSIWASIPTVFVAVAAWVVMLSSANGQVPQSALQALSFHALLGLESSNTLLQNLSLPALWSMALLVIGYRQFTAVSWGKAVLVTLGPYLLIYGIWALFIVL